MLEKKLEMRVIGPGLVAAKKNASIKEREEKTMVGWEGATTLDENEEVSFSAIESSVNSP